MSSYLDEIVQRTRGRLEAERRPIGEVEAEAQAAPPIRDFLAAIRQEGISLVAEIKRSSPSVGPIRADANPASIAEAYERGGARALSVLTEPEFFSGSIEDLGHARGATSLPVLRKDFVIDGYQVVEARAGGADALLLIVAAVTKGKLEELLVEAERWGLTPLVEVHDEKELEIAMESGAKLLGINQRSLRTFEVDRSLAARLRPGVPKEIGVIAESGIWTRSDVLRIEEAGLDAVLVGEALMRAEDPAQATAELLGRSAQ